MTNKIEDHVVLQPDQKGLKFYGDKSKALKVFDAIIQRLAEKGPPYHSAHVPQADQFLPSNLKKETVEHAIFLFTLCLWMRGGVESDTAADFLKRMFEKRPELFVPSLYSDPANTVRQIEMITAALIDYKLGQRVNENANGWVYNMRKLSRHWGGDPRKLMDDQPKFEVLAKRMIGKTTTKDGTFRNEDKPHGFMFFRAKMTSMIAYFYMDGNLVPMFYTPVPVDFHVLRLLTATQIFRVKGRTTKKAVGIDFYRAGNLKIARDITEWYCRERKISPVALCDALWLLSRTLCRDNPGNTGYVLDDRRKMFTEIKKNCNIRTDYLFEINGTTEAPQSATSDLFADLGDVRGRKRYRGLRFKPEELRHPSMVGRFERSCGVCAVKEFCKYNISSGAYYVKGMLLPERLRVIPPNQQRDFLDHPDFEGSRGALVDPTVRYSKIPMEISG